MRVVAAIGIGLLAVGAAFTWATDWAVAGADGGTIGAILMIVGGIGLLALLVVSASRSASVRDRGLDGSEAFDEPDQRLTAGWPRR